MQRIPRLTDVYAQSQAKADAKHAELQAEVAAGEHALQFPVTMMPPSSDAYQRAKWRQINGDAIFPGDVPSEEQKHISELQAKIKDLESKIQS